MFHELAEVLADYLAALRDTISTGSLAGGFLAPPTDLPRPLGMQEETVPWNWSTEDQGAAGSPLPGRVPTVRVRPTVRVARH
jgi:hypothetical protein